MQCSGLKDSWTCPCKNPLSARPGSTGVSSSFIGLRDRKGICSPSQARAAQCSRKGAVNEQRWLTGPEAHSLNVEIRERRARASSSSSGLPLPEQQLLSPVSFIVLPLVFPPGLSLCPANQVLAMFDPSPPVMYMRNGIWVRELFEEQRANASVTAMPQDPVINRSLLASFHLGLSLPSTL